MEFRTLVIIAITLWCIAFLSVTYLGDVAYREQKYDRAIFLRTLLMKIAPFSAKSLQWRGAAYFAKKQFDEAIRDFRSAIKLDEGLHQAYFGLLNSLTVQKRLAEFAPFADQIVRVRPKVAETYNVRGVYFTCLDRYEDALSNYNRALELSPENPCYLTNKAWVIYKSGHVDDAYVLYKSILTSTPEFSQARKNLAVIYLDESRYEEALPQVNELLKFDAKNSHYWFLRSRINRNLEHYQKALDDINITLSYESGYYGYYIERGITYYWMSNYEQAIGDYERAIELAPDESCPYVDRSLAYILLDRIDEAHADAVKAYELEADSKYAISLLALTSFMKGQVDEAQRLWRDMVELDERYMDVAWTVEDLGWKDRLVTETEKLIATF